jgi:hypothetical protein
MVMHSQLARFYLAWMREKALLLELVRRYIIDIVDALQCIIIS